MSTITIWDVLDTVNNNPDVSPVGNPLVVSHGRTTTVVIQLEHHDGSIVEYHTKITRWLRWRYVSMWVSRRKPYGVVRKRRVLINPGRETLREAIV